MAYIGAVVLSKGGSYNKYSRIGHNKLMNDRAASMMRQ